MFGQRPWSPAAPPPTSSDPNALLQSIDQKTTMIYHWVRAGVVVLIVLVIIAILVG